MALECEKGDFSVFNATRFVDALIESESEIRRYTSGHVMHIAEHAFDESKLKGVFCFRLPNFSISRTYLTDAAVKAWRDNGLRGLDFRLLWSGGD